MQFDCVSCLLVMWAYMHLPNSLMEIYFEDGFNGLTNVSDDTQTNLHGIRHFYLSDTRKVIYCDVVRMLLQSPWVWPMFTTPQRSPVWPFINNIGGEVSWCLLTSNQMVKPCLCSLYEMMNSSKTSARWGYSYMRLMKWLRECYDKDMIITSDPGNILFWIQVKKLWEPFERIMGKRT